MEVFLYFLCKNIQKSMLSHHQKFLCQNQSKCSTAFLTLHFPRAIHICGYSILPRFVKVLYLSSICVNFQPTQCIFTINFKHFPSSPNYVRGVSKENMFYLLEFSLQVSSLFSLDPKHLCDSGYHRRKIDNDQPRL